MEPVTIKIHRLDKTLPLPAYQTPGSVAFDLASRINIEIAPGQIIKIPNGIIVEVPPGYGLFVFPRSSLCTRMGLVLPHSVGVIDQDYRGPEDEIMTQVMNITNKSVTVRHGDRVAQALLLPVPRVEFKEIDRVTATSRGGYGSTGV